MKNQIRDKFRYLQPGAGTYEGYVQEAISFAKEKQLMDKDLWKLFADQFREGADGNGNGWRGEFWGKLMRGGCLVYLYQPQQELYDVLTQATEELLKRQEPSGRLSSYSPETEFNGWDLWCRKYVLLGLQYFYPICKEEELKQRMLTAMCRHTDYIMEHIGKEAGKKGINEASNSWFGLNSSSILEPVVYLYQLTGQQKYLDFASYIIEEGGTGIYNIFTHALENTPLPYEYPVTKAYEMMSCYEGLLEYAKVTDSLQWKFAAENYAYLLKDSDITIMGSAGCAHELLNHATVEQCDPDNLGLMQETCVTVTWMKFCSRMLRLTGDSVFADELEKSMYNDMLGAVNSEESKNNGGLPFDSYAPVINGPRGRGIAGYMSFAEHGDKGFYGCCVSIGATGLALFPLTAVMESDAGIVLNQYLQGTTKAKTPAGNAVQLTMQTAYPVEGSIGVTLDLDTEDAFEIKVRIPGWSKKNVVKVNGVVCGGIQAGQYYSLRRLWKAGDTIAIELDMRGRVIHAPEGGLNPNGKHHVAIQRGPVVLARDVRLKDGPLDSVVIPAEEEDGYITLKPSNTADFNRILEFEVPTKDGGSILMIDGASAGKTWDESSMMSVWLPTEKYWEVDWNQPAALWFPGQRSWALEDWCSVSTGTEGRVVVSGKIGELQDDASIAVFFEAAEDGYFRIRRVATGKYFTVAGDGENGTPVYEKDFSKDGTQLWKVEPYIKDYYKIRSVSCGKLLSRNGENNAIHVWDNCNCDKHFWAVRKCRKG